MNEKQETTRPAKPEAIEHTPTTPVRSASVVEILPDGMRVYAPAPHYRGTK